MFCKEILVLLEKWEQNKGAHIDLDPNELVLVDQLEQKNYLSRIEINTFDLKELTRAKSELLEIHERQQTINKEFKPATDTILYTQAPTTKIAIQTLSQELDTLTKREKELRTKILALSEISMTVQESVEIRGSRYITTYAGKELVNNLRIRIPRVSNFALEDFEREMTQLNTTFSSAAKKSFEILEKISPRFSNIEEIHLRSTVIGLSFRNESSEEIASKFIVIMDMLNETVATYAESALLADFFSRYENTILLAECIIHTIGRDFTPQHIASEITIIIGLVNLVNNYVAQRELIINYVLLLYPLHFTREKNEELLKNATDFTVKLAETSAFDTKETLPLLLLELMGKELTIEVLEKFRRIYQQIYTSTLTTRVQGITTALFIISKLEEDKAIKRFTMIKEYLDRFGEDGMSVPAALLMLVPAEIDEILDILRLASAKVAQQRLSLGGMENLSLGMKMFLHSSIISPLIFAEPEQVARIPAFTDIPLAMTTVTAFHAQTMHRIAISHYMFHPIHSHFIYG